MAEEHINLQKPKTNKIYGVVKMGANNSDKQAIKSLQKDGYNEHEIQSMAGVHYTVVRTFMKFNDPKFEEVEAAPTADTQHLHDRIDELEAAVKASDEARIALLASNDSDDEGDEE